MAKAEKKEEALGFVTRKVLLTFVYPVAFILNGSVVMTHTAFAEYQETTEEKQRRHGYGNNSTVVALGDGRKFPKGQHLELSGYATLAAVVEVGEEAI